MFPGTSTLRRRLVAATALAVATVVLAAAAFPGTSEVKVILDDYKITLPTSVPAGPTVFLIENTGEVSHGFSIRTPGTEPKEVAALPAQLAPGESGTLEAQLEAGVYEVVDPTKDHEERGMLQRLVVTKPGS